MDVLPIVVVFEKEYPGKYVGVLFIVLFTFNTLVKADPADQQRAPVTVPLADKVGIVVGIVGDPAATKEYEGPSAIVDT